MDGKFEKPNLKKKISFAVFIIYILLSARVYAQTINRFGKNILERFIPPHGYVRLDYADNSFQQYLRLYPLKEYTAPVLLYNGETKVHNVHVSVFSMPLLRQDLIQCADAIIKLKAEYLYSKKKFSEISFNITNGMSVPFERYSKGDRVIVNNNKTVWQEGYKKGTTRDIFDEYLKFIYIYAGTYSLAHEAKHTNLEHIKIGDFFIYGGNPGHAVLVLDLAQDRKTGKKIMLLGQSYMPSQEFHILKSFEDISPWYYVQEGDLVTPEWTFKQNSLMCFE